MPLRLPRGGHRDAAPAAEEDTSAWRRRSPSPAPMAQRTCLAIADAVSEWSPVTIKTLMDAVWQRAMASLTPFRGGSIMAVRPTKTRSLSGKLCLSSSKASLAGAEKGL